MTENKQEFRRRIRGQQPAVNEAMVIGNLLNHPWFLKADTVMAYSAISPEIDLMPVLKAVLSAGKKLLLPRCEEDCRMTAREIGGLEELQNGAYGILEPGNDAPVFPPEDIQLVLVPGLAFDPMGHRMGRGKGYYDRFLTKTKGKTMGICRCLVPSVPVDDHDIRMDAVITEDKIILCEMEDSPCLDGKEN